MTPFLLPSLSVCIQFLIFLFWTSDNDDNAEKDLLSSDKDLLEDVTKYLQDVVINYLGT